MVKQAALKNVEICAQENLVAKFNTGNHLYSRLEDGIASLALMHLLLACQNRQPLTLHQNMRFTQMHMPMVPGL